MDGARLRWREAVVAGSCLALGAAARAGLGIARLGDLVGAQLRGCAVLPGLPEPPASRIVLLARTPSAVLGAAARALAASVRHALR